MYFYLHRNSKKWTFYSVKILKCESFLSALRRHSKKGPFYDNNNKSFIADNCPYTYIKKIKNTSTKIQHSKL